MPTIGECTQSYIIALNGVADRLEEMLDWCDAAGEYGGATVSVSKRTLQELLHDVDVTRAAMSVGAKVTL